MKSSALLASTALALAALSAPASAALVTVCGPTICYEYDDAQPGIGKFGSPNLIGDAMQFLPVDFRAESANGAGFNVDSATFLFNRVYSLSGADIVSVMVSESGDYRIINGGFVDVDLFLQAASNVNAFDFTVDLNNFAASGPSGGAQLWSLGASVSPAAVFTSLANDMAVTVQNTLTAFTGNTGELAWIQKKLILEVAVVPVPAAVWLFGSGLALLGFARRRQQLAA